MKAADIEPPEEHQTDLDPAAPSARSVDDPTVLSAVDFGSAKPEELARADTAQLYQRTYVRQDPSWWHHFTRNALALGLALLLAVLTITAMVAAIAGVNGDVISNAAQLTITPVVALCGTAFGFYFAQQAAGRDDRDSS